MDENFSLADIEVILVPILAGLPGYANCAGIH